MSDLVEPANLGVEVTAQQEVGSNLGGTRQLVRQSKKGVSHLCTRKSLTLGRNVNSTKHGILRESKETTFATDPHTLLQWATMNWVTEGRTKVVELHKPVGIPLQDKSSPPWNKILQQVCSAQCAVLRVQPLDVLLTCLLCLSFLRLVRTLELYFDNISAKDVNLFLLKQTYRSLLLVSETDVFCWTDRPPIWQKALTLSRRFIVSDEL